MGQKQDRSVIILYGLCTLLLMATILSFLLSPPGTKKQDLDDLRTEIKEIIAASEETQNNMKESQHTEGITLPSELQDPILARSLLEEAKSLADRFEQQGSVEDLFSSPFSVFNDLEPVRTDQASENSLPKVVVIIDDMGISQKWSRAVVNLPGPLTLSYLPYAEEAQTQVEAAVARGHDIMLHLPMEALGNKMTLTPGLLRVSDTEDNFLRNLQENFSSFDGFYGINNHMGSALTQNQAKMIRIMEFLQAHNLYFIDSRTIHTSIAAETADYVGVPYLVRDVFLDHEDSTEFVEAALKKVEDIAYRTGGAIAIGHPKRATVEALEKWLPTLEEKGLHLISAREKIALDYPDKNIRAFSSDMEGKTFSTLSKLSE